MLQLITLGCLVKLALGSLDDCLAFASKFDNTCESSTNPVDLDSHPGQQVECTGSMLCPGSAQLAEYTADNPCSWNRKLCVTCEQNEDETVIIRVQTNTLPNHCFESTNETPTEANLEWRAQWQGKFGMQSTFVDFARMDLYDSRGSVGVPACEKIDNGKKRFAIVIGMDGVRKAALEVANTPTLDSLVAEGMYSWNAETQNATTYSAPGWTSIMTGVNANKHGAWHNGDYSQRSEDYKTWLWWGKHEYQQDTLAIVQWDQYPGQIIESDATTFQMMDLVTYEPDPDLGSFAHTPLKDEDLSKIRDGNYQMIFVTLDTPDYAGHGYGFEPNKLEYIKALEKVDVQIKSILDTIEARPTRQDEEWMIALSTDHSGKGTSHGGSSTEEARKIFLIIKGDGLKQGHEISPDSRIPVSHKDIFPSVIEYLGLGFNQRMNLDGKSRIEWEDNRNDCIFSEFFPVISFSGAYIFNDKTENSSHCPRMPTTSGRLHYNTWMQYLDAKNSAKGTSGSCDSGWTITDMPRGAIDSDIGLALDGHRVLGPYNGDGELWSADEHDYCNGVYLADGSYAYVSTTYAPYTVGCWGGNLNSAIYLAPLFAATLAILV